LYRLTDLFRSAERSLALKQSRNVSAEDLKDHDVILLGGFLSNDWSGKLPITEDFVHTVSAMIENRHPQPAQNPKYPPLFTQQNGDLVQDYALTTVKPNILYENTIMVLAGSHSAGTEAAAEYVTSKNYLQEFTKRLRQMGGSGGAPKYYQALLKVGVENGIPTTISLLVIHQLRPSNRERQVLAYPLICAFCPFCFSSSLVNMSRKREPYKPPAKEDNIDPGPIILACRRRHGAIEL